MFEFNGVFTKEILFTSSKKQNIRNFCVIVIPISVSIIVTIILGVLKSKFFIEFLVLTFLISLAGILIISVQPKSKVFNLPKKIIINIDKNEISDEIQGLKEKYSKPRIKRISRIKSILDYGDWYLICFKFDITDTLVIQKDLIVEGTIEEFEELFKGKIIKKYNKEKQG